LRERDRALIEIFSAEQAEHVSRLRALADALGAPDAGGPAFEEALRSAHTLKGAARAVGLEETEFLMHRLETAFARMRSGELVPGADRAAAVHRVLDAAEDILACALAGREEPDTSGARRLLDMLLGPTPREAVPSRPEPVPANKIEEPAGAGSNRTVSPGAFADMVRLDAGSVDALIAYSSQLFSAATAESAAGKLLEAHLQSGAETLEDWQRLRRQCASYVRSRQEDPSFAPVLECLNYADGRFRSLGAEARAAAAAERHRTWELRRRSEELHRSAVRVRMTPADTVFGAFGAMVRDLARDESKEVDFRAEGLEAQADRLVLQGLKDPVMHLLRNAVSHGIEPAAERASAGKPSAGRIRLRVESRAGRLRVSVEDDGRGIDRDAVRREALKRGLLVEGAGAVHSPEELLNVIFRPGFSTSKAITSLAGRGVGLSVVRQAVSRLHGDITVGRLDGGALFTISVPISISTQHLLLAAVGNYVFGLPAAFIERLCRAGISSIQTMDGKDVIISDSRPVLLTKLADLLGLPEGETRPASEDEGDRVFQIAVVAVGEQRAGIVVDRLLEHREAVVKDLGLPSSMAGLASGGIPLEDGTVAVVLDAAALLDRFAGSAKGAGLKSLAGEPKKPAPRILVVDDSITTRSLEKSILEAHGYEVRVAVDGVEALEQLRADPANLVITDVMMPRMDGLELLRQMKGDKDLAHIPIIVVTSLERREDQEQGLSLGADAYIVKRKFDQRELLNTVRQIL
jgi:two-component system chemotaxis sensor kinase CheA